MPYQGGKGNTPAFLGSSSPSLGFPSEFSCCGQRIDSTSLQYLTQCPFVSAEGGVFHDVGDAIYAQRPLLKALQKYHRDYRSFRITFLGIPKRHEDIILYKKYTSENYPKYDNYNAIEVSKVTDIPVDYDDWIGVPITFLNKYNPEQFEILGLLADKREQSGAFLQGVPTYLDEGHKRYVGAILNGKATYSRIIIRRKKGR